MFLSKRKIQLLSTFPCGAWISGNVCTTPFYSPDLITLATDIDNPLSDVSTLYDLIANVTHESIAGTTRDKENTAWKVYLRAAGGGGEIDRWYMIQDLIVEETRKEMIFLGEAVLQVCKSIRYYRELNSISLLHSLDLGKTK